MYIDSDAFRNEAAVTEAGEPFSGFAGDCECGVAVGSADALNSFNMPKGICVHISGDILLNAVGGVRLEQAVIVRNQTGEERAAYFVVGAKRGGPAGGDSFKLATRVIVKYFDLCNSFRVLSGRHVCSLEGCVRR